MLECHDFGQTCNHLSSLAEARHRQELILAMEILATREDVRSWQPHEREAAAIGSATDGGDLALDTAIRHGLTGEINDMHHGLNLLAHVIVLVADCQGNRALAILRIEFINEMRQLLLAILKAVAAEVTYDVLQGRLLHRAVHMSQVEETVVALSVLGSLEARQIADELARHAHRVTHFVVGRARVNISAREDDCGLGRIERLILQLANSSAINGVGKLSTEALDIEMVSTLANLLIRSEAYADFAMLALGVSHEILHCGKYGCDTRFVISPEERGAIGDNNILPYIIEELRKLNGREGYAKLLIECDVFAIIGRDDTRFDILC